MNKFHKRIFERNDNRELLIYGRAEHAEKHTQELDVTLPSYHTCDGILLGKNG